VYCPVECVTSDDPSINEILCDKNIDHNGCPMESRCEGSCQTDNNGDPCPPLCPVTCQLNETMCMGWKQDNGCWTAETCVASGDSCPTPGT
jgi:hypothetical protein